MTDPTQLTEAEQAWERGYDRGYTVGQLTAERDKVAALAKAARDYLAHDGSGIGRTDEWAGDFDAMDLAKARERLRAILAALEPDQ